MDSLVFVGDLVIGVNSNLRYGKREWIYEYSRFLIIKYTAVDFNGIRMLNYI